MVGVLFPPMNTPSPESMAEVMTQLKRSCDLAHRSPTKAMQPLSVFSLLVIDDLAPFSCIDNEFMPTLIS